MLLELNSVHAFYGKIEALRGVSLRVREHAIVSLLGANGAGKTTTVRTIVGLHRSPGNDIRFDNAPIGNVPPHQIVGLGISMVPERRELFPDMSVIDNLEMGAYRRQKKDTAQDLERVFDLFPRLLERREQSGGTLSGGEQQMLAIGRALMARPTLMLLDEPSMGLAPMYIRQIFSIIGQVRDQGTTVLLVEQNANQALNLTDRGYCLETGSISKAGTGSELLKDPAIREAYLGG
jgi:branched-chain amino acid transport system ATP-binding protein